jgi:hypothetical protein
LAAGERVAAEGLEVIQALLAVEEQVEEDVVVGFRHVRSPGLMPLSLQIVARAAGSGREWYQTRL